MTAIMKEEKDENFTGSIWTTEPHSEEVASSSTSVVDSTAEGDNEVPSTSAEEANESEDPTHHIIEPDEEEEMWEKVNERKRTFNTLPPRPARGSKASEVWFSLYLCSLRCTNYF